MTKPRYQTSAKERNIKFIGGFSCRAATVVSNMFAKKTAAKYPIPSRKIIAEIPALRSGHNDQIQSDSITKSYAIVYEKTGTK
jgi:hypothetical protein